MLRVSTSGFQTSAILSFNGHPPLGVNATSKPHVPPPCAPVRGFQWAPTLGGECYREMYDANLDAPLVFQWAPTLGGECYRDSYRRRLTTLTPSRFQWAPTLGGECYATDKVRQLLQAAEVAGFNGHPPLGVNATSRSHNLL